MNNFYPTLTESLQEEAGIVIKEYDFSYLIEGHYNVLLPKGKSTVRLQDELETWKIENDGMRFTRQIVVEYPDRLKGKTGIICEDAEFGICIIWNNHSQTQMGYILPDNVKRISGKLYFQFIHEFEAGQIKGDLSLNTVLYLKTPSDNPKHDERRFINEAGVILGELENLTLDFDSLYMDFPIRDVNEKDKPLWWLELEQWDDPAANPFNEDYVCLYLNTYYDYCPKVGDTIKNVELLIEIVSTAYLMIFKKIEEMGTNYLTNMINETDLEPGSISMVMHYFWENCDPPLRVESIDLLQKTIHQNIEKMLKGEES